MPWNIEITDDASAEMRLTYYYIFLVLSNPIAAINFLEKISNAIDSLQEFPKRYKIREEEKFKCKNIRSMPVDNYLILYIVDEKSNTVTVAHIINGKQNIENI